MPELGTAWMTLAISTKGAQRDITAAMRAAEKSARLSPDVDTAGLSRKASTAGRRFGDLFGRAARVSPDVDTSRIGAQGTRAGEEFGRRFSGTAKTAMAALSAAAVGSVVVDQFRQVMTVGMDYTKNMNTLPAVTRAGADEMAKAGAAARQLGVDVSLPATSTNDAAAAMTELAKGGLTLQQSMEASRGTLQLAAAAGVSAQQAAVIQSDALNTFQLGADQANRVADLLANAANASSGEITDFAQGLAQAGGVAAGFKVPIEDTMTSLAMFAKFGIKGSDAGTMMKTSIQAITDSSKPAQAAIDSLGLSLYDAAGKFVGYPEMLNQVAAAQSKMNLTDEQFQSATNTLFGSDSMRAAMVAANGGAAEFDDLQKQVTRVGGAAEVAAAKTKGLPGAWERVKNSLESLQLKAYDVVEGPIAKALDMLNRAMDGMANVGDNSTFRAILDAVTAAAPGIAGIAVSLGKAAAAIGVVAWKAFTTALQAAAGVLKVFAPVINGIGSMMKANQGAVTAFVGAWVALKVLPGLLSPVSAALSTLAQRASAMKAGAGSARESWSTLAKWMEQSNPTVLRSSRVLFGVGDSARTASAHMRVFGATARAAVTGGLGMARSAVSGLVGALGGPLNIALMGATVAFGLIASKNADAAAAVDGYRQSVKQTSDAQIALNEALLKSNGLMDDAAKAAAGQRVQSAVGELGAASKSDASWLDQFRDSEGSLWGGFKSQIFNLGGANEQNNLGYAKDVRADTAKSAKEAIDGLKLSEQALSDQVTGSQPIFDALVASLEKQGSGGYVAAERLKQAREAVIGAQDASAAAAPVLAKLGDDVVKSAADIKTAFSALPTDVPINVNMDGGKPVYDMLVAIGEKVTTDNDKNIVVNSPLAPEVLRMLDALGYAVRTDNDKLIVVKQEGAEAAEDAINRASKDRTAVIRVLAETASAGLGAGAALGVDIPGRANGAVVPMAFGGLRQIAKPQTAGIYAGRGAGTIFAEEETGGEAYIPLAPGKRARSLKIFAEVARLFGVNRMNDGGLTVDEVKAFASRISGRGYQWGAGDGNTFDSDCSGAQSTLVNAITGASGRFSTATEGQELLARGFQGGDPPQGVAAYWVGWVNGGPGGGHTAGTIVDPAGGNVNVEMGGAAGKGQFGAGAAGAANFPNRAWIALAGGDDPRNTSSAVMSASASVTRSRASVTGAQARLDQAEAEVSELSAKGASAEKRAVAEKRRDAAQTALDAATEKQAAAEQKLTEVKEKEAERSEKAANPAGDAQGFGQSLFSGVLQGMGLDGSLFSNPFDWPNVKSVMAGLNWGGGLLSNIVGGGQQDGAAVAGGGPGMPNVADFLKPIGPTAMQPVQLPDQPHPGSGAAPGNVYNYNGPMGVRDYKELEQRNKTQANQSVQRNLGALGR